jgi:hypothetical protein
LTNIGASNGLLGQYFPKSTDMSTHDPADLAAVAAELKDAPAKPSTGTPPPKPSPGYCQHLQPAVLRRPVETAAAGHGDAVEHPLGQLPDPSPA